MTSRLLIVAASVLGMAFQASCADETYSIKISAVKGGESYRATFSQLGTFGRVWREKDGAVLSDEKWSQDWKDSVDITTGKIKPGDKVPDKITVKFNEMKLL